MWHPHASKGVHTRGTEGPEKLALLYCLPSPMLLMPADVSVGVVVTGLDFEDTFEPFSSGPHTHTRFFSHPMRSSQKSERQLLNIKLNYKNKWRRRKGSRHAWKQAGKVKSKRRIVEQFRSVWNELMRPLTKSFNLKYPFHLWTL